MLKSNVGSEFVYTTFEGEQKNLCGEEWLDHLSAEHFQTADRGSRINIHAAQSDRTPRLDLLFHSSSANLCKKPNCKWKRRVSEVLCASLIHILYKIREAVSVINTLSCPQEILCREHSADNFLHSFLWGSCIDYRIYHENYWFTPNNSIVSRLYVYFIKVVYVS